MTVMKMIIIAVVFVLVCACTAQADRLPYTSEMIDVATIIGAWHPSDIKREGDSMVLQKPSRLFKGDLLLLQKTTSYSSRLQAAITGTAGRGTILFINVREGRADLVSDLAFLPCNGIAEKVVSEIVAQLTLRANWDKLTIREHIEHSDIIVSGSFLKVGEDVPEDRNPSITVDTTFRGTSPTKIVLLPTGVTPEKGKFIFFANRYFGTGPDYILMRAIPMERATKYLDVLRERDAQQGAEVDAVIRAP